MFKRLNRIGVFQIVLISLSAIISLKSLPLFAEVGLSIVFFLGIATLFFFIPISMIVAELSTAFPSSGGCYLWIKQAYGKSWAFFVMWLYWMEGIIWFPTMLIFIIAMLGNCMLPVFPNLDNNPLFLVSGIVLVFWILTFLNFFGIRISAIFSVFGVLFGTVVPVILIIFFGFYWVFSGNTISISINLSSIIPDFNFNNLVFFSGILLGMSGIELISFYVCEADDPAYSIARSIVVSSIIILFVYILGSLSIAIIIPKSDISFAAGVIQALSRFFNSVGLSAITPFVAFLLLLGSLSGMNTWIVGPSKGLFVAANDGFLPKFLCYANSKNVPVVLLVFQAIIGSSLSIFFYFYVNSINGLVWIFVCLSFQFASFLYIMIFLSALKLRKVCAGVTRPFKVPFIKFFAYSGIILCIFTFCISYVHPSDIDIIDRNFYSILLFFAFFLLILPALFCIVFKK